MQKSRGTSKIFSERLRSARELRKLSQSELASRAKLQPSAISHFETGTRRPSFDNLRRLADELTVSIDYLLGRSDSIGGVAQTTDVLYQSIEKLSTSDREVIKTIAKELAKRNSDSQDDAAVVYTATAAASAANGGKLEKQIIKYGLKLLEE